MREEQLKCFEATTSVSLDQKLKKAQVQCFPNNTSLRKDISVRCFSISIWILLAPVNCML